MTENRSAYGAFFFGKTGNYQNSIDDMSATSFS